MTPLVHRVGRLMMLGEPHREDSRYCPFWPAERPRSAHTDGPVWLRRTVCTKHQCRPTKTLTHYNCRMVILLLSCVARKQPAPAPAKELYISAWFRKARCYADRTGQPWFVLSAKHGLVNPDDVISPYDLTLNTMPVADRRQWAGRVLNQLEPHLDGVGSVVFLAGRRYREFLEPSLRGRGLAVSVPLEGLGIGKQLRWLTEMLHG